MLGRERDRIAEAEPEGLVGLQVAGPALGLVGQQDHGLARPAHEVGEVPVVRGHADARVDDEQDRVGISQRLLGLRAHASGQGRRFGLLESGRVDDREAEVAEARLAFAAVARHAGLVVDQRELLADEPVEQRRLADVRPADDGHREVHGHCPLELRYSRGSKFLSGSFSVTRAGIDRARNCSCRHLPARAINSQA